MNSITETTRELRKRKWNEPDFYKTAPSMKYLSSEQIKTLEQTIAEFVFPEKVNELETNLKGPEPFKGDFWTNSATHSYKTWGLTALVAFKENKISEDDFTTVCSLQNAVQEYAYDQSEFSETHSESGQFINAIKSPSQFNVSEQIQAFRAIRPAKQKTYDKYFRLIFTESFSLEAIKKQTEALPLSQQTIFTINLQNAPIHHFAPMYNAIIRALDNPFFFKPLEEQGQSKRIHLSIGMFRIFLKALAEQKGTSRATFTPIFGEVSGTQIALCKKNFERVLGLSIPSLPPPQEADGVPVGPSTFEDHDKYHCIKDALHSWNHHIALNRIYDLFLAYPPDLQKDPVFQTIFGHFIDAERLYDSSTNGRVRFSDLFNDPVMVDNALLSNVVVLVKKRILQDMATFPDFWTKILEERDLENLSKADKALLEEQKNTNIPLTPLPLSELEHLFVLPEGFLLKVLNYLDARNGQTSSLIDFIQGIDTAHTLANDRLDRLIQTKWIQAFSKGALLSPKCLSFILSTPPSQIPFIFELMRTHKFSLNQIIENTSFEGELDRQHRIEYYKKNISLFENLIHTKRLNADDPILIDQEYSPQAQLLLTFSGQVIEKVSPDSKSHLYFDSTIQTLAYLTSNNQYCFIGELNPDKRTLLSKLFTTLMIKKAPCMTFDSDTIDSEEMIEERYRIFDLVVNANPKQMILFAKHLSFIKEDVMTNLELIATSSKGTS